MHVVANHQDLESIYPILSKARSVMVMGSNLMAAESACYIKDRINFQTEVVLCEPGPVPQVTRDFGAKVGYEILKNMQMLGIATYLNQRYYEIIGSKSRVEKVRLKSEVYYPDVVLLCGENAVKYESIIKKPVIQFSKNQKIATNEYLQTEFPQIYSVGANASYKDLYLKGQYTPLNIHDQKHLSAIAALNMLGY